VLEICIVHSHADIFTPVSNATAQVLPLPANRSNTVSPRRVSYGSAVQGTGWVSAWDGACCRCGAYPSHHRAAASARRPAFGQQECLLALISEEPAFAEDDVSDRLKTRDANFEEGIDPRSSVEHHSDPVLLQYPGALHSRGLLRVAKCCGSDRGIGDWTQMDQIESGVKSPGL
jgi:hypothetical protein